MNNEVAVRASVEAEVTGFEMKPRNLKEAMDFCELMAKSDLVADSYKDKPGNILVAIQMGSELGMGPMRSLRCIAVINKRASIWGDDMLAMVKASPLCEYVYESDSTDTKGVCKAKRKGQPEEVRTFSLEDAKRAGLLGKTGSWQGYTKRMLQLRARGFALRDTFPDVLAGLITTEEAMDTRQEEMMPEEAPSPPPTLKEKLKAQVETTAPQEAPGSVLEPPTEEILKEMKREMEPPIGTDELLHEFLEKFNLVEYIKAWAELKNDSLCYQWTPEQSKLINDRSGLALKRLKEGEKKKR